MGDAGLIRTSSFLATLAFSAVSCLACAQGTEISPTEVVVLPVLPEEPDAGTADAGSVPAAAAPEEQVGTEADP